MDSNLLSFTEQERRQLFFSIVENNIISRIKSFNLAVQFLRPVQFSHVNFVYKCCIDDIVVILKANFFDRSMLFCYEEFMRIGVERFQESLYDYSCTGFCLEITSEVNNLRLLKKSRIPVPEMILHCPPNIVLYEKLETSAKWMPTEEAADILSKIHSIPIPVGVPERRIQIFDQATIIVQDSNFVSPIIIQNVAFPTILLIERLMEQKKVLLHGDFKSNNLLKTTDRLYVIDPKLCVGIPEMDIGKFILRELLLINDYEYTEAVQSLSRFIQSYASKNDLESGELERASIAIGLIELQKLLEKPQRPNIDMLGDEMLRLYHHKNEVSYLCDEVLRSGKPLTIDDILYFIRSHF